MTIPHGSAERLPPQPQIKPGWIARGTGVDIDKAAKEGVQFKGWNNKEYVIKPVPPKMLASGANGTVYKIEVYVKKFDESNNLIALKPKTLIAKVNNQNKHSSSETATLKVLHDGQQHEGINVWYATLEMTDPKTNEKKDWIILKTYNKGDLHTMIRLPQFYANNEYRQQISTVLIPQLLNGLKRILETNILNIDIKALNVLLKEDDKGMEAALADMGKSPQLMSKVTFENYQELEDIYDLAHTQLYAGMVTPAAILNYKKSAYKLAENAVELMEKAEAIETEKPDKAKQMRDEANKCMEEAQIPLQKAHALTKALQLNLMAAVLTDLLLDVKPFKTDGGMPVPYSIEEFRTTLEASLAQKGMDKRYAQVINLLLSEIPSYDDLAAYTEHGTKNLEIPPDKGGPKIVQFIPDNPLEKVDEALRLIDEIYQSLFPPETTE